MCSIYQFCHKVSLIPLIFNLNAHCTHFIFNMTYFSIDNALSARFSLFFLLRYFDLWVRWSICGHLAVVQQHFHTVVSTLWQLQPLHLLSCSNYNYSAVLLCVPISGQVEEEGWLVIDEFFCTCCLCACKVHQLN